MDNLTEIFPSETIYLAREVTKLEKIYCLLNFLASWSQHSSLKIKPSTVLTDRSRYQGYKPLRISIQLYSVYYRVFIHYIVCTYTYIYVRDKTVFLGQTVHAREEKIAIKARR